MSVDNPLTTLKAAIDELPMVDFGVAEERLVAKRRRRRASASTAGVFVSLCAVAAVVIPITNQHSAATPPNSSKTIASSAAPPSSQAATEQQVLETTNANALGSSDNAAVVGATSTSVYLTGIFSKPDGTQANLVRVDSATLKITAYASMPDNSTYDVTTSGVWVATGALLPSGCNCKPTASKLVLLLDPDTLKQTSQITTPTPPLLTTSIGGSLWVATATRLLKVSPTTGAIVLSLASTGSPVGLAGSTDGKTVAVLLSNKSGLEVRAYDESSAALTGDYQSSAATDGPIVSVSNGFWFPEQNIGSRSSTMTLLTSDTLHVGAQLTGQEFIPWPVAIGNQLVIVDTEGVAKTVCVDATTGTIIAREDPAGSSTMPAASSGDDLYVAEGSSSDDRLVAARLAPACASS